MVIYSTANIDTRTLIFTILKACGYHFSVQDIRNNYSRGKVNDGSQTKAAEKCR